MASSDQATSTDAVSVLLNAAPSSVVQSFESAFESLTSDLLGSTSQPTAAPTSQSQPTDTPSNAPPASLPASRPTQNTNPPISSPFSRPTIFSTPTPSTFLTAAARPTSTTPTPSTTPLPATSSSTTGQLKNASVAGVATGLAAAFVLFTLAAIYLYRRHQQGKPLPFFSSSSGRFSRLARSRGTNNNRDSQRAFPESAWLYDPARTPPRNGSPPPQLPPLEHEMQEDRHFSSSTLGLGVGEGSASEMLLIPEPREGAVELGGSAPNSPPRGVSSPLLALPTATSRGGGGGRRGSGSGIGIGGGAAGAGAGAGLGISGAAARAESPPASQQDRRRRSGSPSSGSGSWGRRSTSQSPTPGRRSRGNSLGVGSRTDLTRPMSAIWEEAPLRGGGGGGGGFVDDRTGLLAPISGGNLARHST
ncbi:hypothetical protein LTR91_012916 [Friedmanniomyces endolithicus]|uniref:Uncharacterized protein n=1 Tax=Friedmanniomyces endolithicus TaxID=329885 RepID=A0AAN6KEI7_9PEZI|nr:hypothetical protein LTR94_004012 [Friedmanniomyces endolithicus]KAK0779456.1 hypothetical protein LTR75_015327 [Friedmanniomyces endolithicus]KAK0789389.1 hypothetical protein LTR59_009632 [Friedmanniomyces endolithicus]KAK0799350.1 hypothetical protein LTR38_007536 [Friedmanniomyces endolithicus]KAK0842575.1 hypothetical protein LTR03_009191 [Friedmanniomyces endolithicus]